MAQIILHLISITLSVIAIRLWYNAGQLNRFVESMRWWPLSLFVDNLLFSLTALIDLTAFDLLSNVMLNYWGQAVRIHMLIILIVGAARMIEFFKVRPNNHAN